MNDEVVHGIPNDGRVLDEGDIVTVDVGVKLDGWCSDSAWTFPVGTVDEGTKALLDVTEASLMAAVEATRPGNHIGDLGAAVMATVKGTGHSIVRDLVGHGIGREVHEEPQVPNMGISGQGPPLRPGMVLAIEPMISAGSVPDSDPRGRLDCHYGGPVSIRPFRAHGGGNRGRTQDPDAPARRGWPIALESLASCG